MNPCPLCGQPSTTTHACGWQPTPSWWINIPNWNVYGTFKPDDHLVRAIRRALKEKP